MPINNVQSGPDFEPVDNLKNARETELQIELEPCEDKLETSPLAPRPVGASEKNCGFVPVVSTGRGATKRTLGLPRKNAVMGTPPGETEPQEFPPDIAAAFASYETPALSRDFEARFWAKFAARRGRYRGLGGLLRCAWELEIEGVLVWRLALSTLAGGATCALFFALALGFSSPHNAPMQTTQIAAKPPGSMPEFPDTPRLAFNGRAFYAREWEFDRASQPKIAPRPRALPQKAGGISWLDSAPHLA